MEIELHPKLQDIENAPAFDKSCHPRCDPNRATTPIAKKLLYIPHYRLANNLELDTDKINAELEIVAHGKWASYNNDVKGIRGAGFSTYWNARMLRNFVPDSEFGFGETMDYMEQLGRSDEIKEGRVPPEYLTQTPLFNEIPYIVSIIERFVTIDMCDRILISRVENQQRINWHSHNYYEKTYTHAYLHIPLQTDESTEMLVYMDGILHRQHYNVGEAWVINTQHNHAVNNKLNSKDRYHILVLANFEDPKFNALFLD